MGTIVKVQLLNENGRVSEASMTVGDTRYSIQGLSNPDESTEALLDAIHAVVLAFPAKKNFDRPLYKLQTYDDGTPIYEGDSIRLIKQSGLLPGYTTEGVALRHPQETNGVLFLAQRRESTAGNPETAYTAYVHITHGGSLTKL